MESHKHRTISIRESDYTYLTDVANLLGVRERRRVSFCEAMNWLTQQAKDLKINLPKTSEVTVSKGRSKNHE